MATSSVEFMRHSSVQIRGGAPDYQNYLCSCNNVIYQAVDDGEAAKALDDFEAEWGDKYPSIAPSWRRAWQEVIPFFAFPPAVRKIIYTTNAIESLNRVIRKTTKTRGSFPTDAAATKLIYRKRPVVTLPGRNSTASATPAK